MKLEDIQPLELGGQVADEKPPGAKVAVAEKLEVQPPPRRPKSTFLLADDVLRLRGRDAIKLPYVTREEIMDKGKSDSFARVTASRE